MLQVRSQLLAMTVRRHHSQSRWPQCKVISLDWKQCSELFSPTQPLPRRLSPSLPTHHSLILHYNCPSLFSQTMHRQVLLQTLLFQALRLGQSLADTKVFARHHSLAFPSPRRHRRLTLLRRTSPFLGWNPWVSTSRQPMQIRVVWPHRLLPFPVMPPFPVVFGDGDLLCTLPPFLKLPELQQLTALWMVLQCPLYESPSKSSPLSL